MSEYPMYQAPDGRLFKVGERYPGITMFYGFQVKRPGGWWEGCSFLNRGIDSYATPSELQKKLDDYAAQKGWIAVETD